MSNVNLTVLGLTAAEAQLYDLVVEHPPLTREEIRNLWETPAT